jgi:hypothetical protein
VARGRGILAGSVGAVGGCAVGGGLMWLVHGWLDPVLEGRGSPLEELQGVVSSLVLLGAGVGLAVGCVVALKLAGQGTAWLTALLVLAVVPFLTPLVALAGRIAWQAALATGIVAVIAVVAAVRLLLTRAADDPLAVPPVSERNGS